MVKIKKIIFIFTYLLAITIGGLACFFGLSYFGKIQTKIPLEITIQDYEATYDGKAKFANSYKITNGQLGNGDKLVINYLNSQTTVGECVSDATVQIYSSNETDITNNYDINVVKGKIKVNKANITVNVTNTVDYASSADELNLSGVFTLTSGSIPDDLMLFPYVSSEYKRSSTNVPVDCKVVTRETYTDMSNNFNITVNGTAKFNKIPLTIKTNSKSKTYDENYFDIDTDDYLIYGLYGKDTYEYTGDFSNIENVSDSGTYLEFSEHSKFKIYDENKNDVTSSYAIDWVETGTLNIYSKAVTITTNNYTKTYDSKMVKNDDGSDNLSVTCFDSSVAANITFDNDTVQDAGVYVNSVSINKNFDTSNYNITYQFGYITINKAEGTFITDSYNKVYDGETLTTRELGNVTFVGDPIIQNSFDISFDLYKKPVSDAGTYTNSLNLKLNDSNLNSNNFLINYNYGTVVIDKKDVKLSTNYYTKIYDGEPIDNLGYEPVLTYSFDDSNLDQYKDSFVKNAEYEIIKNQYVNVGTYTNFVELEYNENININNYNIINNFGFMVINKKAITITTNDINKTYDGLGVADSDIEVNVNDDVFSEKVNITEDSLGLKNAGTYQNTVTVEFINEEDSSNYDVSYRVGTITINKKTVDIKTPSYTKTYDGATIDLANLEYEISDSDLENALNINYNNKDVTKVGTYQNSVTWSKKITSKNLDLNNYNIVTNFGDIVINKKDVTITSIDYIKTYDGSSYQNNDLEIYTTDSDFESLNYTYTGLAAINAGIYVNKFKLSDNQIDESNYNITYKFGTITINKKDLELTSRDDQKIYDTEPYNNLNVTSSLDLGLDYELQNDSLIKAGTYAIKFKVKDENSDELKNYNIVYNYGTLIINKKDVTISTSSFTKTYGDAITTDYEINDDTFESYIDVTNNLNGILDAGTYTNSLTWKLKDDLSDDYEHILNNYNVITEFGTVTVNKKTVNISTKDYNATYSAQTTALDLSSSCTISDDTLNDKITVSFDNTNSVNAGRYTNSVTITFKDGYTSEESNYDIKYNFGIITINKAKIDIYFASYVQEVNTTCKPRSNDASFYLNGSVDKSISSIFSFKSENFKQANACTIDYVLDTSFKDSNIKDNYEVTLHSGSISFYA